MSKSTTEISTSKLKLEVKSISTIGMEFQISAVDFNSSSEGVHKIFCYIVEWHNLIIVWVQELTGIGHGCCCWDRSRSTVVTVDSTGNTRTDELSAILLCEIVFAFLFHSSRYIQAWKPCDRRLYQWRRCTGFAIEMIIGTAGQLGNFQTNRFAVG